MSWSLYAISIGGVKTITKFGEHLMRDPPCTLNQLHKNSSSKVVEVAYLTDHLGFLIRYL